jgi:hypothetical protein
MFGIGTTELLIILAMVAIAVVLFAAMLKRGK